MPNVRKVERPAKSAERRVDRRVGRTRARLGQALRKLMEQRPLEKISVQDVIELAGVSRSAFYAHYDDKVDLLLSDMDEFLERMAMLLVVRSEQSNRIAPVHEFFAHVGEAEEIRGALARSERLQDFFDLAVEHFARGIELRLRQLAERGKDPTAPPARWINRRCELRSRRACARGSIHWFSQLLAPQRSTAFSESGGHSVSQIRLGRNNKCRGYERGTHFLKTE